MHTICGRDRSRVESARSQLGWQYAATDWEEVVESPLIDIVDICISRGKNFDENRHQRKGGNFSIIVKQKIDDYSISQIFRKDTHGGGISANTHYEYGMKFIGDILKRKYGQGWNPVFVDGPSFSDIHRPNQQNYVDQVIRASSDEEYSKKALEDFLFRGTNYQHLTAGTTQGLKSVTLEEVKSHYKNFFTRTNITIGIAGDYTPEFLSKLKSDMAALSPVAAVIPPPAKPKIPEGLNVEIVSKDNALGSAIFAGFPMDITRAKDDFAALMVANSWMGEHRKSYSRLFQKIREDRSMNYGDYTYIEWYENGGSNMLPVSGVPRSSNYFSIWIRPVQTAKGLKGQYPELSDISIGQAHYALRMVMKEMDNLIQKGMPQQDFNLTRDFLRSYMKLYIQSPERQLGFLMDSHFYGRKDYIMEMDALLAKLTLADVNAAVKKYWQTKNMDIVIITDKTEAEPLAKSLRENAPSPMSYSNSLKSALSKDILEEDKAVEKYPMPVKNVKVVSSDETFRSTENSKDSKGVLKMAK